MRRSMRCWLRRMLSVLAVVVFLTTSIVANAQSKFYVGPASGASANWDNAANWSATSGGAGGAGVPAAGDTVNITGSDGVARTITFDTFEETFALGSLTIDLTGGTGAPTDTLSMSDTNILLSSSGNEIVGNSGSGTITQSGGSNSLAASSLMLGNLAGSVGTYNLSGTGSLSGASLEYIGVNGTGVFTQSGGSNGLSSGTLQIGLDSGSNGTYNLSGDEYLQAYVENVGNHGTGAFNQSGGTNEIGTMLTVGLEHIGTYTLSGGLLHAVGEHIGSSATGTFTQTGGQNEISGLDGFEIGVSFSSTGAYNLSGGTVTAYGVSIGTLGGSGTLSVSGTGVLEDDYGIVVGPTNGESINLSGGTILTPALNFNGKPSVLDWTGGTLDLNYSDSTWDPAAGPSTTSAAFGPTLTLGNSQTLETVNETLGGTSGASHAFTLTVNSGGTNNVNGMLTVNSGSQLILNGGTITTNGLILNPGSQLNLNAGVINTPALNFGGLPSVLNWTGGTLNLQNSVTWDGGAQNTTTSAAFGHFLSLSSNQTLTITGDETLGFNASFFLEVDSSGTNGVSGTLTVNPLGELNINGGTVTAGSLHNIGLLNVNGGTTNFGSITLDGSGSLSFGLSGTTRGTGYGVLSTTGNAALNGSLTVTLNSFTPAAGEAFDILDWGTRSGKFASLSLPSLPSGLVWSTLGLYSSGELIVANSTLLPGDFNRDNHVDARDIGPMMQALTNLSTYQSSHGNISTAQVNLIGDINGDGKFNNADLQALLNALTSGGGSADPVPEPASLALLGLGALATVFRCRSRLTGASTVCVWTTSAPSSG